MVRSLIGTDVEIPAWVRRRSGMLRSFRAELTDDHDGARGIDAEQVLTLNAEASRICGCLAAHNTTGHFNNTVILNPDRDWIDGRKVALIYENLMYVGDLDSIRQDRMTWATVGRVDSMWWVVTTLEQDGWYGNDGVRLAGQYEFNPPYTADGTEILVTQVANGTRALGTMMRYDGGMNAVPIGDSPLSDYGMGLDRWVIASYIRPQPHHRSAVPPGTPVEWVDTMADLTPEQKIVRLNERFTALTRATASKAVDEDWCGNYEEACEAMGLAEDDYTKEEEEDVTYSVTVRLTYNLSAESFDEILNSRFGGTHDVRDSMDVQSLVSLTVTQKGDFDEDAHDWDELLENAGYDDYDEIDVQNWVTN